MAQNNFGVTLSKGDAATPPVFTPIGEINSISGLDFTLDTVDSTTLASVNGFEQAIATVIRSGNPSFTVNLEPTTHITQFQDMVARSIDPYQVSFNDLTTPSTFEFNAFVTGFNVSDMTSDGKLEATITLKPTGAFTFTAGS